METRSLRSRDGDESSMRGGSVRGSFYRSSFRSGTQGGMSVTTAADRRRRRREKEEHRAQKAITVSADEVTAMKQSVHAIRQAADRKISEKAAEVHELEMENQRLIIELAAGRDDDSETRDLVLALERELEAKKAEVRDLKAVVGKADTERAALSDRDHAMNREVAELRSQIAAQKLITASALERLEVRHQRMSLMAENQLTRRMQAQASDVDMLAARVYHAKQSGERLQSTLDAVERRIGHYGEDMALKRRTHDRLRETGAHPADEVVILSEMSRLGTQVVDELIHKVEKVLKSEADEEPTAEELNLALAKSGAAGSSWRQSLMASGYGSFRSGGGAAPGSLYNQSLGLGGDYSLVDAADRPRDPLLVVVQKGQRREDGADRLLHRLNKESERRALEEGRDDGLAERLRRLELEIRLEAEPGVAVMTYTAVDSTPTGLAAEPDFEILGAAKEGALLEAKPNVAKLGGSLDHYTYEWWRRSKHGRDRIEFASTPHYLTTLGDVGAYIICEVQPRDANGDPCGPLAKDRVGKIEAAEPTMSEARIEGPPLNTSLLEAAGTYFGGKEGGTEYQWWRSRDGGASFEPIAGRRAQESRYQATSEDLMSVLKCEITPIRRDGAVGETVSAISAPIDLDPEMEEMLRSYWRNGTAVFSCKGSERADTNDWERVSVEFGRRAVDVRTRSGGQFATVPYGRYTRALLHPTDVRVCRVDAGEDGGVVLKAADSYERDLIALTTFGFAQTREHRFDEFLKSIRSRHRGSSSRRR